MSEMKRTLKAVFENDPPKRYLPRATGDGHAWRVWDVLTERFLNDGEVRNIDPKELLIRA